MRRRDVLRGTAAFVSALAVADGSSVPASAQTTTFKVSDVHPPGYPTVVAVENLGKKLQAATNGRLGVQTFASMQLGGEKEAIEQAQVGALQMARVSVGAIGPVIDDLNVFNLPFLFRNTAHMQKVTANDKAGLVGLCWMDAGARSFYNTKHPIKSIADLKGLKVRVIGNPMFVDMANALGANGVAMGYDQVFSALQTGVIDGAENNPPSFVFDNHYQVAKNYTLTEHLIVPEILVFSRKSWDSLSKDDQALIRNFAREAQAEERVFWTDYEKQAMDKARSGGVQIVETIDKRPFQDAVKPVWDKYGPRFSELIKRIQAVS